MKSSIIEKKVFESVTMEVVFESRNEMIFLIGILNGNGKRLKEFYKEATQHWSELPKLSDEAMDEAKKGLSGMWDTLESILDICEE